MKIENKIVFSIFKIEHYFQEDYFAHHCCDLLFVFHARLAPLCWRGLYDLCKCCCSCYFVQGFAVEIMISNVPRAHKVDAALLCCRAAAEVKTYMYATTLHKRIVGRGRTVMGFGDFRPEARLFKSHTSCHVRSLGYAVARSASNTLSVLSSGELLNGSC